MDPAARAMCFAKLKMIAPANIEPAVMPSVAVAIIAVSSFKITLMLVACPWAPRS